MNKFYKNFISAVMTICCICLLTGCGTAKTSADSRMEITINPKEVSEEQFIEITSPEEAVLCQVVGKKAIIDFIQNKKMEEWEEVSEIPIQGELQYIITSYEKVTEEFWLEKGAPEISVGEERLYKYNGDFYIEDVFGDYVAIYRIPVSAGEYMVALARNGSNILDKNDIFSAWGIDDFDVENREEADLKGLDEIIGVENEADNHSFSADELATVSKEQKVEISCQNLGIVCTMTDLEEIADFYNQIKRDTWLNIEQLPEGKNNVCEITTYQLERHTIKKNLIENEKLTLFEAQNQHYVLDVIPNNSSDVDDMEIYYSIPDDVANYIKNLANNKY